MKAALKDENARETILDAALSAWNELQPNEPMKKSTRLRDKPKKRRDTLKKDKQEQRPRTVGPRSYVNRTSRVLQKLAAEAEEVPNKVTNKPPRDIECSSAEADYAAFFEREALKKPCARLAYLLKRARHAFSGSY